MGNGEHLGQMGIYRLVTRFLRFPRRGAEQLDRELVEDLPREVHNISPSDARNALTNLDRNSARNLDEFAPGAGFSGVYNPDLDKFLAYPSGDTRLLNGEFPSNLVERYGGHVDVNDAFCRATGADSTTNVGFAAVMKDDGSFGVRWTSRSVNSFNPSFEGVQVPEHMRNPIMNALAGATGRTVRSDA